MITGQIISRYECGWNNCVGGDGNPNSYVFIGLTSGGRISTALRGDNGVDFSTVGTSNLANGQWHYVVITLDRASQQISTYVDAVRETQISLAPVNAINDGGSSFEVGRRMNIPGPSDYFPGSLDELALYQYSLSQAQISAHFAAAQP